MSTIGEVIKEYRKSKDMTQAQLGERLFVSKQAVSKWERNATLPDIDMLRKISAVLDIPVGAIMQKATGDPRLEGEEKRIYPEMTGDRSESSDSSDSGVEAWRDYKFGMFIHYGVYSVIGRINEWVMFHEPIDRDDYAEIAREQFRAEAFSGEYYAKLAKSVGMKYMVLTTRHHDGFALFDSKCSHRDFTVMNTPCGRDLVSDYTDACRKEGLGVGFYYSPLDWRFEGFFMPKMYRRSAEAMREQCFGQVRELMENYGKIDLLWFDGGEDGWMAFGNDLNKVSPEKSYGPLVPEFWDEYRMHELVRGLQPHIVINNRYGMHRLGDYTTPECRVGDFDPIHPWETCDTLIDGSWGWVPGKSIKSLSAIINILVDVATGGGNLLFNVSPRPDGSLDPKHEARMLEVGQWMDKYGEAIHKTHGGPFKNDVAIGGFTYRENSLFVFIKEGAEASVDLPLLGAHVVSVSAWGGESLDSREENGRLKVSLKGERTPIVSVIEIKLDRSIVEIYGPISEENVFVSEQKKDESN